MTIKVFFLKKNKIISIIIGIKEIWIKKMMESEV